MPNSKAISSVIIIISFTLLAVGMSGSFLVWNVATSENIEDTVQQEREQMITRGNAGFEILDIEYATKQVIVKNNGKVDLETNTFAFYLNGTLVSATPDKTKIKPGETVTFIISTPSDLSNYDVTLSGPYNTRDIIFIGQITTTSTTSTTTTTLTGFTFCSDCNSCTDAIAAADPGDIIMAQNDLTGDSNGCIDFVVKDQVTFDCDGYAINGIDNGIGIRLGSYYNSGGADYNTIKNCIVEGFDTAVLLCEDSDHNDITDLDVSSNIHGFEVEYSDNNNLNRISSIDNFEKGLWFSNSIGNNLNDSFISGNDVGILFFEETSLCNVENSIIENNNQGIEIWDEPLMQGLDIANNIFNNTQNVLFTGTFSDNDWNNVVPAPGPNIIGGPDKGGNYWVKPDGTGFSDTCTDADTDGFCDNPYDVEHGDGDCSDAVNCDWLPLTT